MKRLAWVAAGLGAACGGQAASAGQPAGKARDHHARPRLVAEHVSASPGGTINLGVTFDIDPKWHLYWNGQNDSGFPVSMELTLPEGFEAGSAQWPAPERLLMPGDILDHIYEGRVTLIIPVTVPADAKPGDQARFGAHLEWMECSTLCLLADGDVALSIPVTSQAGEASPEAPLFAEARARIPVPLPDKAEGLSLSWERSELRVQAPGADYLAFYPGANGVALSEAATAGESKLGELQLRFNWPVDGSGERSPRVQGVLEIRRAGRAAELFAIDLAAGQTGPNPQPATQPGTGPGGIR